MMLKYLRLAAFAMFLSIVSLNLLADGPNEPWASDVHPTDVSKSHVQDITTSPFSWRFGRPTEIPVDGVRGGARS